MSALHLLSGMPCARWWWAGSLVLIACEGQVGALGEERAPNVVVIRNRSGPELVSFACSAATVSTREMFTCTAQARHPTNEVLRCSLDAGDGLAPIELGDCSAPMTTQVRYSSPGSWTLAVRTVGRGAALGGELLVPVTLRQPEEGDELHFFAVIPWLGELSKVSLARGGRVIATREASRLPLSAEVQLQRVDANTIRVAWLGGATATIAHLGRSEPR